MAKRIPVGTISSRKLGIGSANASINNLVDQFIRGETENLRVSGAGFSSSTLKKIQAARRSFAAKQAASPTQVTTGQAATATPAPGTTVGTLPKTFEEALAQANAKNEERFQQGLDLFKQQQANVDKFGQTRREQLGRTLQQQNASDASNLISRGLFNTTGLENLQRARQEDVGFQRTALEEAIARSRNDILSQQTGFIERRTDAGPDPALFAQLQTAASGAPRITNDILSSARTRGGQVANPIQRSPSGVSLVTRNQGSTTPSRTASTTSQNRLSFNDQQTLLGILAEKLKGGSFAKLSGSERNQVLREAGVNISSVNDARKLSDSQIQRIEDAIARLKGGSTSASRSKVGSLRSSGFGFNAGDFIT